MLKRTFQAFESRDFRLVWAGACTSSIGTWMQKLAQSWLVLQLSGSPFLLGLDAFLGEVPILLFSLVGGVVADRMDRRRLLVASQIAQASCAFVLATLFALGAVQVWQILTLSFLVGVAQAFGGPAYQALIPTLVPAEGLSAAIAWNSIQFNLARVVGPVLGGLALTKLGATWCFGLNGASYLGPILALVALGPRRLPERTGETMVESMKQGIRFIRTRPAMLSLIVLAFVMTILGIPVIVFLPVFARDVFRQGPSTYTLLLSVSGIGSVLGALAVAATGHRGRQGTVALSTLVALGVCITAFSLSRNLAASCVFLFLGGASLVATFATVTSLVQSIAPDEMRGRVMAVYSVFFRGGMPLGSLITGSLVPRFGAPVVLAVNGALLAVLGLTFIARRRKLASM
ncbi:MAG: MFS transporter [Acidobacteria bacterium]|nr:MFS transporter [Acidobacteriota bacterium]